MTYSLQCYDKIHHYLLDLAREWSYIIGIERDKNNQTKVKKMKEMKIHSIALYTKIMESNIPRLGMSAASRMAGTIIDNNFPYHDHNRSFSYCSWLKKYSESEYCDLMRETMLDMPFDGYVTLTHPNVEEPWGQEVFKQAMLEADVIRFVCELNRIATRDMIDTSLFLSNLT